jgi:DNA mismatch repair protein MutS2
VGEDTINFDRHLQDIVRDKRYWENKRQQIRQREKRIEELEQQYLLELESISKQRKEIVRKAKKEAQDILSTTNATIENTIRKIKESQADKEKTKEARSSLQNLKNQLQEESISDDLISRKIEKLQKKKDARKLSKIKNSEKEEIQFAKGMIVRVKGQSIVGEIFEIQGNKAIVIFGTIKTNVKTTDLELVDKKQLRNIERKSQPIISSVNENLRQRKLQFKTDIDIRGMRVDEALQAVMYFIDDAQMIGVSSVRILHGTGHGILRDVVRQYLSSISGIVAYHDEHIQLGGSGITVVKLG